jgi:hypothetical protein
LVAVLLVVVAVSGPTVVGDGPEYIGMAMSIIEFGSPAPTPAQADVIAGELEAYDLPLLRDSLHEGREGRLYYRHFWLYPALATPAVWLARATGLHPAWGFALVNVCLFATALCLVVGAAGGRTAALLFAGPIVWWIDKPHPEVFVFSLLAAGFALFRRHPGVSLLVWSIAVAQYPPLGVLLACAVLLVAWLHTGLLRERQFVGATLVAVVIAATHPLYYQWNLGVISGFVFWGRPPALPGWREWSAIFTDLNIGLAVNAPFLVAAIVVAVVATVVAVSGSRPAGAGSARGDDEPSRRRALVAMGTAATAALLLPAAFAQTVNVNHGATPGMSRYALWLIPLSIPALIGFEAAGRWRPLDRALTALVVLSVGWCALFFRPSLPESYTEPTRIAAWVWTRAPRLSAPLPEIFSERTRGREPGTLPAATPGCEKVLLLSSAWPAPCAPVAVPVACRQPGSLCYADRRSAPPGTYRFRPLRQPPHVGYAVTSETWPPAYQETVAAALQRLRWWEMTRTSLSEPDSVVRASHEIDWTAWRLGPGRFFLYAHGVTPGTASLTLRLPEPMSGAFYDAASGAMVGTARSPDEAGELWNVAVPMTREGAAILIMTASGFDAR